MTPPVAGADFLAALVASCLRGALPPVDLRAVYSKKERTLADELLLVQISGLPYCCTKVGRLQVVVPLAMNPSDSMIATYLFGTGHFECLLML